MSVKIGQIRYDFANPRQLVSLKTCSYTFSSGRALNEVYWRCINILFQLNIFRCFGNRWKHIFGVK